MSNSVNLTRIASRSIAGGNAPLPGRGEDAKKEADKYKPVTEATVVRRTIPVTTPSEPQDEPEPVAATTPDATAEKDRHTKWREAQEAKRAARTAAGLEAAAKRQGFAKELLAKGDLAGASRALGIPASELVTLVNQAAMGMAPEPAKVTPPTPEEQRAADETAFRAEMKAFRAEQESYRNAQAMTSFVEKSIRPVLADKDAYEMIHAAGAEDIETYAYRYMNQHYYDTSEKDAAGKIAKPGEVLNAKDVLDAIEENLVKAQEAAATKMRGIKKLSKHFAPLGEELAGAVVEGVTVEEAGSTSLTSARRARIAQAIQEEAAEGVAEAAELGAAETPEPATDPAQPKIVRQPAVGGNLRVTKVAGGRLTAAEKVARARAEEAAEARAALFKGGKK